MPSPYHAQKISSSVSWDSAVVESATWKDGTDHNERMEVEVFYYSPRKPCATPKKSVQVRQSEDRLITEDHLLNKIQQVCRILHQTLSKEKYERHITARVHARVQVGAVFPHLGFTLERRPSSVSTAGKGVFVASGHIKKHAVVAFYPGTVYRPGEHVFCQSVANSFLLRCADGVLIDGNDSGLSKLVYRSCSFRDRVGALLLSDLTWTTEFPANPLAVGQYVNNAPDAKAANVSYQEADLPIKHFPAEYRRYLPNIPYNSSLLAVSDDPVLKLVLLVAIRDIEMDEELFSTYFTMITE